MKPKEKISYQNKFLTEKIEYDEIIYSICVEDVQEVALDKIGRKLDFDELRQARKIIENGFWNWELVIKNAIGNLE